jgi:hypothetical protein
LLLAGGQPEAGALDSFLFGCAAPADVWLHRRYNYDGVSRLRWTALIDPVTA